MGPFHQIGVSLEKDRRQQSQPREPEVLGDDGGNREHNRKDHGGVDLEGTLLDWILVGDFVELPRKDNTARDADYYEDDVSVKAFARLRMVVEKLQPSSAAHSANSVCSSHTSNSCRLVLVLELVLELIRERKTVRYLLVKSNFDCCVDFCETTCVFVDP